MGGAREARTGRQDRLGILFFSDWRSIETSCAMPMTNNSGMRMAQSRPTETGVIAANNTATTQKNARSLRSEVIGSGRIFRDHTRSQGIIFKSYNQLIFFAYLAVGVF